MKLCFDSIDEVKTFVAALKTTRGGKKDDAAGDDTQGAALGQIAAAQGNTGLPAGNVGFAGQTANLSPVAGPGAAPGAAGAFPGAGQTVQAQPQQVQLHPLAKAIIERSDASIAAGHPVDGVTTWFRGLLGPEAAQATWEQIKTLFIPRLSEAQLKQMAPQLGLPV
jgi:hypothetical protein